MSLETIEQEPRFSSYTFQTVFEPSSQLTFRHTFADFEKTHKRVELFCGKCGSHKTVIQNCGSRSCDYCRNRVVTKILKRKGLDKGIDGNIRFMTLTLKTLPDLNRVTLERVRNYFRKLIRRVGWKRYVLGGLYVIEVTRVKSGYHYHFHVLYYGHYFPYAELQSLWYRVTNGSYICWITAVQDGKKAFDYCLRYVTKCEKGNIDSAEYEYIFHKIKLVQFFGCWTKLKQQKIHIPCRECGFDAWITEYEIMSFERQPWGTSRGGDDS